MLFILLIIRSCERVEDSDMGKGNRNNEYCGRLWLGLKSGYSCGEREREIMYNGDRSWRSWGGSMQNFRWRCLLIVV